MDWPANAPNGPNIIYDAGRPSARCIEILQPLKFCLSEVRIFWKFHEKCKRNRPGLVLFGLSLFGPDRQHGEKTRTSLVTEEQRLPIYDPSGLLQRVVIGLIFFCGLFSSFVSPNPF